MAEFEDIEQNIKLNYETNALDSAKKVEALDDAQESLTRSTKENTKETKKEEEAYKSMKTQIREATQDLLKMSQTYGETSKQAIEAAKKVAQLKDEVGFANDLVEGFNPDRKFQGMATAVNAAAVAASGITSGMALFGAESQETEKALLKVQAAMAFSDAVGRITEMGDDFMKLKAQLISMFTTSTAVKATDTVATTANTVATEANVVAGNQNFLTRAKSVVITGAQTAATGIATAAQWAWNTAMAANPIGALVVAIAAVIAGAYFLIKAFQDSSDASEKAEKANKKLNSELDQLSKTTKKANEETKFHNDAQIAMAKASGKSADAIRKLKEELINQEVAEKNLNVVKAQSIFLEARRIAGLEDATDAEKETAKKAYELFKEQNQAFSDSVKERRQMAINHRVEIVQEETDKNKELVQKQVEHEKKLAADRKAAHEKRIAEEKQRVADIEKAKRTEFENSIATSLALEKQLKENAETPAQKEEREYQEKKAILQITYADTELLEAEHKARLKAIDEEYWAGEAEAGALRTEKNKKDAADDLTIEQAIADQKKAIQDAQFNLADKAVGFLNQIAGKNKALQKAAIIAENAIGIGKMIIANNTANIGALATPQAIATSGASAAPVIALNNITTGIGVASTIAATAKALSAVGGGGGGGGSSTPATPSGGSAPQVGFQNSSENQIATTVSNSNREAGPVKAFVVSSDVTTAQALDRNAIEGNSI